MKIPRWLIYLRNLWLFLVWLGIMLLPCAAFTLAVRGELNWPRGAYASDRLWLVQEREQRGLGYAAVRVTSDQRPTGGPVCVRTQTRFFLWKGSTDNDNIEWCECYDADKTVTSPCQ